MALYKGLFWSSIFIISLILLSYIKNIISPFFTSFVIAYILQPFISKIRQKYQIPRIYIVLGLFIALISVFIIALTIIMPLLYEQISILIHKIPYYNQYLQNELSPYIAKKLQKLDPTVVNKIESFTQSAINNLFTAISQIVSHFWDYTVATLNIVGLIILVPIISFYFLRDWPKMRRNVMGLLPLRHKSHIRNIIGSINDALSSYIRGQLNVCFILSAYYGTGLSLLGLDLGLLIGVISGFLIIIPYIGTFIAFSVAIVIAYLNFGFGNNLFYVVILYGIGMLTEGYALTPKIIGDKIGLHPVWIIFSVLANGSLFGFIGVFFAIPIASIIKVLFTYSVHWYKNSRIYKL